MKYDKLHIKSIPRFSKWHQPINTHYNLISPIISFYFNFQIGKDKQQLNNDIFPYATKPNSPHHIPRGSSSFLSHIHKTFLKCQHTLHLLTPWISHQRHTTYHSYLPLLTNPFLSSTTVATQLNDGEFTYRSMLQWQTTIRTSE